MEISLCAIDKHGVSIDFLLTASRDKNAAMRFFRKAFKDDRLFAPSKIGTDKAKAFPSALRSLPKIIYFLKSTTTTLPRYYNKALKAIIHDGQTNNKCYEAASSLKKDWGQKVHGQSKSKTNCYMIYLEIRG